MEILPLTVGPIIGETTPTRVRIWGRGDAHVIDGQPRRCFGIVQWKLYGDDEWIGSRYFKLNPNFDLTGIAIIDKLEPDNYYEYRMGFYFSEVEINDASVDEITWTRANYSYFKTASAVSTDSRTLILGSCRYLLKTFLGDVFDGRGDKAFRSINNIMENEQIEIDQMILMGDQIYADDLAAFNANKTVEQFFERYRTAFSQKHIKKLMSRLSTYMILDDHEIENDWPAKATEKDYKTVYPNAIHAYQAYQLSHSPNIPIKRGKLEGTPRHLWYKYSDGCCDFFVMDCRTERIVEDGQLIEMVSAEQMRALRRWLADTSGNVKIIISSVPFFPDFGSKDNIDKWSGCERQRQELLTFIETREIDSVVFFSGDVHASVSGELILPSGRKIISIISSSIFWPYPHPRARHFKLTGSIDGGTIGECMLDNFSPLSRDDNFTIVTVDKKKIDVAVHERKGKKILHEYQHIL